MCTLHTAYDEMKYSLRCFLFVINKKWWSPPLEEAAFFWSCSWMDWWLKESSVNCVSVGVFYFLLGCKPHSIHKHIGTRRSLTDACYTEAGFFSTEAEPPPLYFVSCFFFQHHPPEPDLTFVVIPGIFSAHYQNIQGKLKISIKSWIFSPTLINYLLES